MIYKISALIIVLFTMGGMYSVEYMERTEENYVLDKDLDLKNLKRDEIVNYMAVKMVQYKSEDVDPRMISLLRSEIYYCDKLIKHTSKELQKITSVDNNFLNSLELYSQLNCG